MFIHISPEVDTLGETLSTLKFAERVATVELGAARVNKDTSEVKELKEQVHFSPINCHIILYIVQIINSCYIMLSDC